MILQAPWPTLQTTTILPDPEFSDGEGATGGAIPRRTMNNVVRVYRKTKPRRRLTWQFRLTQPKALELLEFVRAYFGSKVKVTDHNSRQWVGFIMVNPIEIRSERSARPDVQDIRGETYSTQLEFEGEEL
jgi:hypothetical protein